MYYLYYYVLLCNVLLCNVFHILIASVEFNHRPIRENTHQNKDVHKWDLPCKFEGSLVGRTIVADALCQRLLCR
jgi:hypothetical protein